MHFGEIDLFVAAKYVISIRHGEAADLRPARERLEEEHRDLLAFGAPAVAWAILDAVVDNYEPVVAGIEDDIEEVEQEVFNARTESIQRIYFLKREVIEFHRAVAPLLARSRRSSAGRTHRSRSGCGRSSGTSATTPAGSTSRSCPTASS